MSSAKTVSVLFLTVALSLICSGPANAGVADGRRVFEAKKCGSCHQSVGPAAEKTIKDQLAKKGPELWYAGSKFRPGFLEGWLANPKPIRPLQYNSVTKKNDGGHARLNTAEATDVAAYLMSLTSNEVRPSNIQPGDNPRGKRVFITKVACYGCHELNSRGKVVGGLSGPSLVGASRRLNVDWVFAYLTNPQVFKPVKDMPNYVGIIDKKEMADLAAYVTGLE
ncbi:MAG: c-type cytochrome [Deltaproteobacteria bacterium]|nr:c-type cytochrome [Deltaproteobacteria bacterium]